MQTDLANLNQPLASFKFITTENAHASFSDFLGKILVLYFYPKDSTPGCTMESKDFRDLYSQFTEEKACILGISRDSLKSHASFKEECALPFPLVSDETQVLCRYFNVLKEKEWNGKKFIGIERSTFLVDRMGILRQEWRDVKIQGHVQAVLESVKRKEWES